MIRHRLHGMLRRTDFTSISIRAGLKNSKRALFGFHINLNDWIITYNLNFMHCDRDDKNLCVALRFILSFTTTWGGSIALTFWFKNNNSIIPSAGGVMQGLLDIELQLQSLCRRSLQGGRGRKGGSSLLPRATMVAVTDGWRQDNRNSAGPCMPWWLPGAADLWLRLSNKSIW